MSANNNTQIERMRELIAILIKADIAYYRDDAPIMLDREYDKLTDELKELEAGTGIILAGSPTQKVSGEILDSLTPVTHSKPMLSADKTKLVSDVQKFARGHSVMLSWKLDGLTLVLRYDNGEFKQAVTRGREGTVGEDVTHTVKTFRNVPLRIPYQGYLELRGEGVTSFENFENINMGLEDPYSLPRSFAAGSVRKLDSNEARKRGIEFYAFELVNEPFATNSKKEQQEFLKSQGFDIVEYILLGVDHSDEEVETAINSFVPEQYGNPTDGVIIEQDDIAYGRSLGGTGHHDNRMLAFKWEDDLHETKFLGVELATTRTGMVSITGLFESVEIDGANVNHAYLHNLDIFDEFQFGVGDTIKVYKANMIIPQIASNETRSNTFKLDMT
ncbi:MAG: NAD-dependent DNA ligase LigA, partial [Clostridia bacterium]|nr:NAD-dependent DNA ligase LigA [Clostridia bacterium]